MKTMYLEKEEMKFAAVYAIKQYKAPMSESRLYKIFTWDKEIMEYFDLSGVLAELLEDNYITKKFYRNEAALCLTQRGEEAYLFFQDRIPFSIRQRINDAIGEVKYDELVDPNVIKAEVLPGENQQYTARCTIVRDKIPVLELSLSVDKKRQAQDIVDSFLNNPFDVYEGILELCKEKDTNN